MPRRTLVAVSSRRANGADATRPEVWLECLGAEGSRLGRVDGDRQVGEGRRVGECSTTDFRPIDRGPRPADDPGMVVKRSVRSVAVYARRSRKKETLGIDVQLGRCRTVAAEEGWRIAEEYVDDDRSAYGSAVRESYDQMMADLAAGRFDAVLVYKADRLGRDDRERRRFEDAYN